MIDVALSPLSTVDVPAVIELLEACDLPTIGVRENAQGFVVARSAGKVVGCCGVEAHGTNGLLRSLAIEPGAIRESWEFRTGCPDTATFMSHRLVG